ncbi:hypothetical protein ACIRBX_36715 [Kitasatospora sp. NPDC096147]|uniref:hypothetical protein n=1 Tax=Kitasatospora sp. NPDC096147 TaxID=3364093 RepID=UPI00382CBD9E
MLLPDEVSRPTEPGTPVAAVGAVALYDQASIGGHLHVRKGSVGYDFDPLGTSVPTQHSDRIRDRLRTPARAVASRLRAPRPRPPDG